MLKILQQFQMAIHINYLNRAKLIKKLYLDIR